jgi:hypothetical protein
VILHSFPIPDEQMAALRQWALIVEDGALDPYFLMRGCGGWAIQSYSGDVMDGFVQEIDFKLESTFPNDFSVRQIESVGFRHDFDQIIPTPVMRGPARELINSISTIYPCRAQLRIILPDRETNPRLASDVSPGRHSTTLVVPLHTEKGWGVEAMNGLIPITEPALIDTSLHHRWVNRAPSRALFLTIKTFDITGTTGMPCPLERWLLELRLRDNYLKRRRSLQGKTQ